jgi:HEAT repeat protein
MTARKILPLIQLLDTQSDRSAEKVIRQLVQVGKPAVPLLIESAKNKALPRIRKWSLQALGAIADDRATPVLTTALRDERMTVRLHALKGLGRIKSKKSIKKVAALLKDDSGGIRVNAIYALIEIGDPSAMTYIRKALSDSQWYVRQNACLACGHFKDSKAESKIRKLLTQDERLAVRIAARDALKKLV